MKFNAPVIVDEYAGISRDREPVTVGVPVPEGVLQKNDLLCLIDCACQSTVPVQTVPLALWPDGSIKWLLLDFQATVAGKNQQTLSLQLADSASPRPASTLNIQESEGEITVTTGTASFCIPTDVFRPFSRVVAGKKQLPAVSGSEVILQDAENNCLLPIITSLEWETKGALRSTLRLSGSFSSKHQGCHPDFVARLTFFAGLATCKIDFAVWNPLAAKHPGGLWDLGDEASFFFKDCSLRLFSAFTGKQQVSWQEKPDGKVETLENNNLVIYQDSSGGRNWQSRNHVNRVNKVQTSFRGYRVLSADEELAAGLRAEPVVSVSTEHRTITAAQPYFWQNFPKSLEADSKSITLRFFPEQFADLFELQAGERKNHNCLLDFSEGPDCLQNMAGWCHNPLMAHSTPEWYATSKAIPYLTAKNSSDDDLLASLLQPAIEGENSFFSRREIIDEYGWRNFGEWYADHEAIGYKGTPPLIAHYNNQYDGIGGSLRQYLHSGDHRWYLLGTQLCSHVRDIDIYHTEQDKPEFNKGLFWHTEHYLPAETATHRCFSRLHAPFRNLTQYGGGPAMSHNYAEGFLYHYYLTGEADSKAALLELAECVLKNIQSRATLTFFLADTARKTRARVRNLLKGEIMVDFDKVYGFNGPGRSAGNAISTLMTAYDLSREKKYLQIAEELLNVCVHPADNIEKMDLLDVENRWMYTVFFQALGKYLDITKNDPNARLWDYCCQCLLHYSRWMVQHEYLYLEHPDNLEYPNETWAAQEIRKCNVLLYAAKFSNEPERKEFVSKARFFYHGGLKQLQAHETRDLTRPLTLLLQNGAMMLWLEHSEEREVLSGSTDKGKTGFPARSRGAGKLFRRLGQVFRMFSLQSEKEFIRWRLKR
jgi:hypothetical protein